MQQVRLGLVGFGNVGQGLAHILRDYAAAYEQKFGVRFVITAVADMRLGCVYHPQGLDLAALLAKVEKDRTLKGLPDAQPDWDALTLAQQAEMDALAEMSYTDLKTGEPASTYIREALRRGVHVVTSNKGPVALHYGELERLAQENGVQLGVEGTVMSGTPALRLGREILAAAGIRRVEGIFNGTTNFILTKMEEGAPYPEALHEAQALGYAEADPTGDVEGYDAAGKVVILARLLMGVQMGMKDVDREGITHLTPEDIRQAKQDGRRWKLIGTLEWKDDRLYASVRPQPIPISHPLAGVGGATNAIHYTTDLLGEVTLIGPGAGRLATGYALLEDLLAICQLTPG
ncbi:MAG: homoserine dehydrogenase [Anaerolineae bacterium]|nr:homoserine dehydrogenase [Anaerolineae bacterium]